jgi:hypothetical protein
MATNNTTATAAPAATPAVAAAPAPSALEQEDADFATAFDELAGSITAPNDDTTTGAAATDTVAGSEAADTVVGSATTDTVAGAAATDTVAGAATTDTVAGSTGQDTVAGGTAPEPTDAEKLAAALAENERLKAASATTAALAAAAPAAEPAAEKPIYTAEEQAVVEQYLKEWPEEAAAHALIRKAEYHGLVKHIFAEISKHIQPLTEYMEARSGKDQYSEIVELVPDYPQVRDATIAWVGKQPAYLKTAFTEVIESGSATDVADLISRFKKETNYQAPAAAAAATTAAPAATTETAAGGMPAAPAAAKAAASLQLVSSARSEPAQGEDKNDFAGSFNEFASTGTK